MPQPSGYSLKKNQIQLITPHKHLDQHLQIHNMTYNKFINRNLVFLWKTHLIIFFFFLEFLESGPFKYRLPINTTYFKHIDDILIFLLQNIKIEEIAEKFNNVEPSINFTYEKE